MTLIRFPIERARACAMPHHSIPCRDCAAEAVVIVYPHIDRRHRKPWPKAFGLCELHRQAKGGQDG